MGIFRVGNNKNASEMRQKCAQMCLVLLGKEERSNMRLKCAKNARNTFGGEHLLDDTNMCSVVSLRIVNTFLRFPG